jgi:hypothetical protein
VLEELAQTPYATWVRESLWGWPSSLTVHAFGTATVVGLIFVIGLRLLGFFRTIPFVALVKLVPVIWIAIVFQALSGSSLWMTKPHQYMADGMFLVKISLVAVGIVLTWFFYGALRREAARWDAEGKVSTIGMRLGAFTVLAWFAVTIAGRLTAYLGSLYTS